MAARQAAGKNKGGSGYIAESGIGDLARHCVSRARILSDACRRPCDHHGNDPRGIAASRILNRTGDNDDYRGAGLLLALATSDRVGPYFDFRDHRRLLLCSHHRRLHSIC